MTAQPDLRPVNSLEFEHVEQLGRAGMRPDITVIGLGPIGAGAINRLSEAFPGGHGIMSAVSNGIGVTLAVNGKHDTHPIFKHFTMDAPQPVGLPNTL